MVTQRSDEEETNMQIVLEQYVLRAVKEINNETNTHTSFTHTGGACGANRVHDIEVTKLAVDDRPPILIGVVFFTSAEYWSIKSTH